MALDDLLHRQLYVESGLPDAELKTTPHGEIPGTPHPPLRPHVHKNVIKM